MDAFLGSGAAGYAILAASALAALAFWRIGRGRGLPARAAWRVGALAAALAFCGCAAGAVAAWRAARRDAEAFPPPGRMTEIGGGRRLHLHCEGPADGRAVAVIVPGWGGLSVMYEGAVAELARTRRACVYDRAGLAWSDAGPLPRTMERQSADLHALLAASGEKGPFVLVAHSYGGLIARDYARRHAADLAGLVLADVSVEYDVYRTAATGGVADTARQYRIFAALAPLGVVRLTAATADPVGEMFGGYFRPVREAVYASYSPKSLAAMASEFSLFADAADDVFLDDLGDLPLAVLTAGQAPSGADRDAAISEALSEAGQARLASLSRRSFRASLSDSDHLVPQRRPDAILAALAWIDAGAPPEAPAIRSSLK